MKTIYYCAWCGKPIEDEKPIEKTDVRPIMYFHRRCYGGSFAYGREYGQEDEI